MQDGMTMPRLDADLWRRLVVSTRSGVCRDGSGRHKSPAGPQCRRAPQIVNHSIRFDTKRIATIRFDMISRLRYDEADS